MPVRHGGTFLYESSRLVKTKLSEIQKKKFKLFKFGGVPLEMQSTKLTYFTTTERGTATEKFN